MNSPLKPLHLSYMDFIQYSNLSESAFWNYVKILRKYSDTKPTNRKRLISDL